MSSFSSLGFTCWFTGLSCSGKSTIATKLCEYLADLSIAYELIDTNTVQTNLSPGLSYSREDKNNNVLRVGFVCSLLNKHKINAVVAMASPYREGREQLKLSLPNFVEIYLNTPREVCLKRLYSKAFADEIPEFTEIALPYEPPENPDLILKNHEQTIEECVAQILEYLYSQKYIFSC